MWRPPSHSCLDDRIEESAVVTPRLLGAKVWPTFQKSLTLNERGRRALRSRMSQVTQVVYQNSISGGNALSVWMWKDAEYINPEIIHRGLRKGSSQGGQVGLKFTSSPAVLWHSPRYRPSGNSNPSNRSSR